MGDVTGDGLAPIAGRRATAAAPGDTCGPRRARVRARPRRAAALVLALVACLALAACSDDGAGTGSAGSTDGRSDGTLAATATAPAPPTTVDRGVPGEAWATVEPQEVGLDPAVLEGLAAAAEAAGSSCLVVVRDGRIAGEWYFGGTGPSTERPVFSVTKSIASTLAGLAVADGALDLDRPAADWIPAWRDGPSASVTVRDLLSNDSGREWSLGIDYRQLLTHPDQTGFAVGLGQQDPPGEVWAYNNSAIQALDAVLEAAVGQHVGAFADERLFGPLGMDDTAMGRDVTGNTLTYAWVSSTCRDLARFGLLMLEDGRWGDQQLLPAGWVQEAAGRPSTDLTAAYGLLWWLNRPGVPADFADEITRADAADPDRPARQVVPGAPEDLYWARGYGNQLVQVHPGSGTVLVRLSDDTDQTSAPVFGAGEAARLVTEGLLDQR